MTVLLLYLQKPRDFHLVTFDMVEDFIQVFRWEIMQIEDSQISINYLMMKVL